MENKFFAQVGAIFLGILSFEAFAADFSWNYDYPGRKKIVAEQFYNANRYMDLCSKMSYIASEKQYMSREDLNTLAKLSEDLVAFSHYSYGNSDCKCNRLMSIYCNEQNGYVDMRCRQISRDLREFIVSERNLWRVWNKFSEISERFEKNKSKNVLFFPYTVIPQDEWIKTPRRDSDD